MDDETQLDPDKIPATGFIAWLIYTGAGGVIASMPWSLAVSLGDLIDPRPVPPVYGMDDFTTFMRGEILRNFIPFIVCLGTAGLLAAGVVKAAGSGSRTGTLLVVAIGGVLGLLVALLVGPPDLLAQLMGVGSGLMGGGMIAFARRLLIQGG